jgi:hypothetical protein
MYYLQYYLRLMSTIASPPRGTAIISWLVYCVLEFWFILSMYSSTSTVQVFDYSSIIDVHECAGNRHFIIYSAVLRLTYYEYRTLVLSTVLVATPSTYLL